MWVNWSIIVRFIELSANTMFLLWKADLSKTTNGKSSMLCSLFHFFFFKKKTEINNIIITFTNIWKGTYGTLFKYLTYLLNYIFIMSILPYDLRMFCKRAPSSSWLFHSIDSMKQLFVARPPKGSLITVSYVAWLKTYCKY